MDAKSIQLTLVDGVPTQLAEVREVFGKLRLIRAQYVTTGDETEGFTIELARITNGQAVVGVLSRLDAPEAIGTDVNIEIGTPAYTKEDGTEEGANTTRFFAAADGTGAVDRAAGKMVTWKADGKAILGPVSVIATLKKKTTAIDVTASKTFEVLLAVVQE